MLTIRYLKEKRTIKDELQTYSQHLQKEKLYFLKFQ